MDSCQDCSSATSYPETSFYSHSTPIGASQVTNVGTSQVANLSTLLLLSYLVHHQLKMFLILLLPVTQLLLVIQLQTMLQVEHHRLVLTLSFLVSSRLIYQLNLRPQSTMVNQGTPPASHPFQLKFLTAAIKVCAGCRGGDDPEGTTFILPCCQREEAVL